MKQIITIFVFIMLLLPVAAQDAVEGAACERASLDGLEVGDSVVITCEAECVGGSAWGTGIYTDDTNLCTGAAHTGLITPEEGGTFVVTLAEGREGYLGSEQNEITSSNWGSWSTSFIFSPVPTSIAWDTTAVTLEGESGTYIPVVCEPDGTTGTVWGTEIYTDDSSICTAALHMGFITMADGGEFYVSIADGQDAYTGSTANDVETRDYGSWARSFVLSLPVTEIDWSTHGTALTGAIGSSYRVLCPAAGEAGSVWGTEFYTDDSSICTAATHAGLATFEAGGLFIVTIEDGQDSYTGSEANGVTTTNWGEWGRSFTLSVWKQPQADI